jgi:hypothetical protein
MNTKANGRDNVGVCRAHPFSWLLSSPQQPLETEDSPTVSLAPQYTSQQPCRARNNLDQWRCGKFVWNLKKSVVKLVEWTYHKLPGRVTFTPMIA